MKLRNLLFGTMIACAFVACSNDDDPIDNGGGNENPTGKTLLQVKSNAVETKAEIAGSAFRVYVIDANGDIVADGPANEAFELKDSRAEGNVDIVVLKNMPVTVKPTRRADLFQIINFSEMEESDQGHNGQEMSQNTAVYKVTIERGKTNKLGYTLSPNDDKVNDLLHSEANPIPAFRNAAQIRLESITLDIEKVSKKYTDASLDIKDVMILNARKSSKMAADDTKIWAKTEDVNSSFLIGAGVDEYNKWVTDAEGKDNKYFTNTEAVREQYYNKDWYKGAVTTYYGYGYKRDDFQNKDGIKKIEIEAKNNKNYISIFPVVGKFFVYENTNMDDPTLLVVKADFKYKKSDGTQGVMEGRYYTVVLGKDLTLGEFDLDAFGISDVKEIEGIRRNIVYSVSMTVTGPGSDNPLYPGSDEDGSLNVSVKLQNYGWVNQKPEID